MSKIIKVNKLQKQHTKTHKKIHKIIQYGGQIDEDYINNVFKFIYNDMFIEENIAMNLETNNELKHEYIKTNILDYEFFNKTELTGKKIFNKIQLNNNNNLNNTNKLKQKEFLEAYDKWVARRFNLEQTESHIRIIDNIPNSKNFQSTNHREFNDYPSGAPYTWNVLCYYKNQNSNLYNSGLGIIYKSKNVDKSRKHIMKRVALPVIDGLTLKIRDCYFFHFTPPLENNKGSKNNSYNNTKTIRRVIIRSYHGNNFENSKFSCIEEHEIEKLPLFKFTRHRTSTTPPVRKRTLIRPKLTKITTS